MSDALGQQIADELRERGAFTALQYQQFQELERVDSKKDLKRFLKKNYMSSVIVTTKANLVADEIEQHASRGLTFSTGFFALDVFLSLLLLPFHSK